MVDQDKIVELRDRIDRIDDKIQRLLDERVTIAQEIARAKSGQHHADFYRPEREAQVLRKIMDRNEGPLSDESMATIFREIMSATLSAEAPIAVGFLGPVGTYSQTAVLKHFGNSVQIEALSTMDEVFGAVEKGDVNYGVVPIENSIEGMVSHTLDKFLDSPLLICGEVNLRIRHQLLTTVSSLRDVSVVFAHGQSLGQCRGWISNNLPDVTLVPVSSNAEAALRARDESGSAAIASSQAAELYKLGILASDIEDNPANTTRFLVIGNKATPPSGDDKTSLLVSSKNKPGALYHLLSPFASHGISMNRIESRPSRQALWEYVFFIDIEGHQEETHIQSALGEMEEEASFVKILGSYPKSVL